MGDTTISYCTKTWQPVIGCPLPLVSPGCVHCWARSLHDQRHRALLAGKHLPELYRRPFGEIQETGRWDEPMRWRKLQVVFVGSQTDLFHEEVSADLVGRVLNVLRRSPAHDFLLLTKRPGRMARLSDLSPIPYVYLGATACTQAEVDAALPVLARLAAAGWRTWLSLEPLLEAVDLHRYQRCAIMPPGVPEPPVDWLPSWVVVGGESGPKARPCDIDWLRSVLLQCNESGTFCYVKQWGSAPRSGDGSTMTSSEVIAGGHVRLRNPHGADPAEWPADLRVRETPWGPR